LKGLNRRAVAALIGAFYYLRIVKLMYFDDPVDHEPITTRGDMRILLSANGLALLVFGVLPQPIMGLCAVVLVQSQFYWFNRPKVKPYFRPEGFPKIDGKAIRFSAEPQTTTQSGQCEHALTI